MTVKDLLALQTGKVDLKGCFIFSNSLDFPSEHWHMVYCTVHIIGAIVWFQGSVDSTIFEKKGRFIKFKYASCWCDIFLVKMNISI